MNPRSQILYNLADGGGGAAPAASGGPAGGPQTSGAGGASPGRTGEIPGGGGALDGSAAAASAWKAPDFLPEHLRDADVAKTFDKVAADWKSLRDRVAAIPPAAKSAEEFAWDPSDKVKPFIAGDIKADPMFKFAQEAALKAGMPAATFTAFVGGLYDAMADAKALPAPYNPEAERDALIGESARLMTAEQKDERIRPMLAPLVGFLDGLLRTNAIDKDGYARLGGLLDTAAGVRALTRIVGLATTTNPGLSGGGQGGGRAATHGELKARLADPRNQPGNFAFDRDFSAETDRLYREMFG